MTLSIMWPNYMCYQTKPFISLVGRIFTNIFKYGGKYFRPCHYTITWSCADSLSERASGTTITPSPSGCDDKFTLDSKDFSLTLCGIIYVTLVFKYTTRYLMVAGIGTLDIRKAIIIAEDILHCLEKLISS